MPLAKTLFALLAASALATVALAAPEPSEMKTVVDPASNLLFAVGGEVDPANGPDAAKVPAARWSEAAAAAGKLQAVAKTLESPAYAAKGQVWTEQARKMDAVSGAAAKAATTHDGAALAQAANDLGDICSACHAVYRPKT